MNHRVCIAALVSMPAVLRAQVTEVSGVRFDNTVQLANTTLLLNGAGTRYKAVFTVYAATRGMEQNSPREEFSRSIAGTLKLSDIFAAKKKLAAGETFAVDWVPGAGTTILVNGKPAGEPIKEPEFYAALMKIWLGPSPADPLLKDALLGKAVAPNQNLN